MSTDFENGLRKTIDLSVRSREFTVDTLKSAMQDFLSGKSQRKGRVSMKKLSEHSGKLENVEIKGIEDFLSVAKKYDIDYAVKKEPGSDTYHVFFYLADRTSWRNDHDGCHCDCAGFPYHRDIYVLRRCTDSHGSHAGQR